MKSQGKSFATVITFAGLALQLLVCETLSAQTGNTRTVPGQVAPRPRVAPPPQAPGNVPGLITVDAGTPLESRPQDWSPAGEGSYYAVQANPAVCSRNTLAAAGFAADMSTEPFQHYWSVRAQLLAIEARPEVKAALDRFEKSVIGVSRLEGVVSMVNLLRRGYEPDNRMVHGVNMRVDADKQIRIYNDSYYAPLVYFAALKPLIASELVPALVSYAEAHKGAVRAIAALYDQARPGPGQLERINQIHKGWRTMRNTCSVRTASLQALHAVHQFRDPQLNLPPNFPGAAAQDLLKIHDALKQDEKIAPLRTMPFPTTTLAWLLLRLRGAESPLPFAANEDANASRAAVLKGAPALVQQIADGSADTLERIEADLRDYNRSELWGAIPGVDKAIRDRRIMLSGLSLADARPMSNAEKARRNTPPTAQDLQGLVTAHSMKSTGYGNVKVGPNDAKSFLFETPTTGRGTAHVNLFNERCAPEQGKQRCRFSRAFHVQWPFLWGSKSEVFEPQEFDIVVHWTEQGLKSDNIDRYPLGFVYVYVPPPPTEYKPMEKTVTDIIIERRMFQGKE